MKISKYCHRTKLRNTSHLLFLNPASDPFELYMFHFVFHVTNPMFKQSQYQDVRTYSSVYLRLAEEYLCVFLPCDTSTVLPELPNHIISQSPHHNLPQR